MKLTKLQRYTAYCIMLSEAEQRNKELKKHGFCWMAYNLFDGMMEEEFMITFLEINKRRPSRLYDCLYFYPRGIWHERIFLLKKVIIETHPLTPIPLADRVLK